MDHKYTTLIFDMDGTVLNTVTDLKNTINYALKKNGFPERTEEEVKSFLGNGMRVLVEKSLPCEVPEETEVKVFEAFKEFYKDHCNDNTRPYEGISELLRELKGEGLKIAIVSNKPDVAVQQLNELYFKDITTLCMGERAGIRRKPAPDMVYEALRIMGREKETAIYIGDSEVDFETAENAGIPCISVTGGFRSREHLKSIGATRFADTPGDIKKYL